MESLLGLSYRRPGSWSRKIVTWRIEKYGIRYYCLFLNFLRAEEEGRCCISFRCYPLGVTWSLSREIQLDDAIQIDFIHRSIQNRGLVQSTFEPHPHYSFAFRLLFSWSKKVFYLTISKDSQHSSEPDWTFKEITRRLSISFIHQRLLYS